MLNCKVCQIAALLVAAGGLISSVHAANEFVVVKRVLALGGSGDCINVVPPQTIQTLNAEAPAAVSVGEVDADPLRFTVIHIFDAATVGGAAPVHSLGDLTIVADADALTQKNLVIFIAGSSAGFFPGAGRAFAPGCIDLGSISVASTGGAADATVRNWSKLYATIRGDVVGSVDVGELR
jgi:hypothetical protein